MMTLMVNDHDDGRRGNIDRRGYHELGVKKEQVREKRVK